MLILVGLVLIQLMVGKVKVRARIIGKVATVLQMVVVLWILLKWEDRWLHVSKGVGNLHGLRFNCRPEICLLTLT